MQYEALSDESTLSTQRVDYGPYRTLKGLMERQSVGSLCMDKHQERWTVCDFGQTNSTASAEV